MAIDIMYDPDSEDKEINTVEGQLVSWVVGHVKEWEDYRDNNFEQRWDEYYRIWRGVWMDKDKARESERSRLISPATAQAIEVSAAEIEEAIFGKGKWFDITDDVEDLEKDDLILFRNKLLEDLNEFGYPRAFSEIILNGCIYGTGIGKISVEETEVYEFGVGARDGYADIMPDVKDKVKVKLTAVEPREFAIDPVARTIDDGMGCAHSLLAPRHSVTMKMQSGVYRNVTLGTFYDSFDTSEKGEIRTGTENQVKITEYHGLVPEILLEGIDQDEDELEAFFETNSEGEINEDEVLVEAIITIANDGELLKAVRNPYVMNDRCFVAYQHDTVPNRFWGRGVAEKGYNPQKALDAELRGRIDAMSLAIHPMMAVDATMLPRGGDLSVRPGKNIMISGDPRQALMPMNFGQVGTNTFQESGDLERMIQMATGAMDSATPIASSQRNNTLGGMSIMQAGAIKRSKRTLANIEATFTKPLIKKSAWRMMQFDPDTYPPTDPKFIVNSTLGIMARELEMQQLAGLLSTTQGNTVGYWMLMRSIYEHTSVSNREVMIQTADKMLQKALNPEPDPIQQQKVAVDQQNAQNDAAKLGIEKSRADTERMRVEKEIVMMQESIKKLQSETALTDTKAEQIRRSTIVETEKAIKEQENKLRELDQGDEQLRLKDKDLNIKVTLSQNEILAEKDQKQMELGLEAMQKGMPVDDDGKVVNIQKAVKKRVRIWATADGGMEGISEPIDDSECDDKKRIKVWKTEDGMEGISEPIDGEKEKATTTS